MNVSTPLLVGGSSAYTTMLASFLVYVSHWPLVPLTEEEGLNIAGLILASVGFIAHICRPNSPP